MTMCRDPHATAPPTTSSTSQRRYMMEMEPKLAEGCTTKVFPVGGVIIRAVIGRFATLPRKDITLATWSSIYPLPVERRRWISICPVWAEPLIHFLWLMS
ncbi:hypothetical protein QQF64_025558 [Cirrhinus molitorella]|uniref:Uncharacterized protein n=1 Tax=Cirrhinus molitorella TaxID=172907 RepID=A0ABR3NPU1_9TELE